MIKPIEKFCFRMDMNGGYQGDTWRCFGIVGEKELFISTPKSYNPDTKIVETQNSQYQIVSFDGKEEDIIKELMQVIKNGGYEHY